MLTRYEHHTTTGATECHTQRAHRNVCKATRGLVLPVSATLAIGTASAPTDSCARAAAGAASVHAHDPCGKPQQAALTHRKVPDSRQHWSLAPRTPQVPT
eukprot:9491162-Pyramimonas_sp.AAC.1